MKKQAGTSYRSGMSIMEVIDMFPDEATPSEARS